MKNMHPMALAAIILAVTFAVFVPKYSISTVGAGRAAVARVNMLTGSVVLCAFDGSHEC